MKPLTYDVSALEHPEPLEIMTEALLEALRGAVLLMIHRREPFPLYDIIKSRSLTYKTFQKSQNLFHIYIAKPQILEQFLAKNQQI